MSEGWSGTWEPALVDGETLEKLRTLAGEPVRMRSGKPFKYVLVNLENGSVIYPATSSAMRGG